MQQIRQLFLQEIAYYRELKNSGASEVSPAPVKNRNVQIFFNADNAYQLKAKTSTPDTGNNQKPNPPNSIQNNWEKCSAKNI